MEIRSYREADRAALLALFGRAGRGAPGGELWGHEPSVRAVFLEPYLELEPDSLLLALDAGESVGYLAGCLDTAGFPGEERRMAEAFRRYRILARPRSMPFLARSLVDLAAGAVRRAPHSGELSDPRWPAHLHIDLAPEARGTGVAYALMERWQARVREHGVPGCYLQTMAENTRAVRFFERTGFVAHGPTPPIPGVRHEGRRVHQLTMVWSAAGSA